MNRLTIGRVLATLSFVLAANPAFAVTRWVNDDDPNGGFYVPPGTSCSNPGYPTIQSAVTAAAPSGDTIVVCPGTYPENVTITLKSLRVIGFGAGVTIVTGVSGTPGPIFDVVGPGNTVTIERLTVDGMSLLAGGVVWGIRYDGTNGVIRSVAVLNIRDPSGAAQGLGIRVQSTLGPANVRIEENLIQNYTRVGINGNFDRVNLYVLKNTVIGPVLPKVWAPNGVQISRGATAQVTGNTVRDATSPAPPAGAGSGILIFCAGPTSVSSNRVFDSDLGITLSDNQRGRVKGNVVRDSIFDAYSLQFIGALFGPLGCPMFPSPSRDNVFEDNLGIDNGEFGISLASFDPNSPVPPTMNSFLRNFIRNSGVDGIRVFGPTGGIDNRFIGNSIAVSVEHDCHDDTIGPGTAGTANTWQNNQGTTSQPPGLCKPDDDDEGEEDDDDFDEDGEHNDEDEDDDNDGENDNEDEDDDNDGQDDDEDDDDDDDNIHDGVDSKHRERQRSSSGTVAGGQTADHTMDVEAGTLVLSGLVEAPNADLLRVEIYDPAGLLVGISPPALGPALIQVPVALPGIYTVRVRNVGLTPVDYIVRVVRSVPW